MKNLEKILEEIKDMLEDNKVIELNSDGTLNKCVIDVKLAWNGINDIICEHMTDGWIPVEEWLPDNAKYILLSFTNFPVPSIGRYEKDTEGGAFYLGDCDEDDTCISMNLFVNAWMPLPEPYRPESNELEEKQEWKERMLRNFLRGHECERREDV